MTAIRLVLVPRLLAFFFRILNRLWRVERIHFPDTSKYPGPWVHAHWHGDELVLLANFSDSGTVVMSSRSKDGEVMRALLEEMGYFVTRGSSSRGGAAGLKGMIDALSQGRKWAALSVDGPRGPIYEVKPGVVKLAQATGAVIVPIACAARSKFVFKNAWNRCYLPYPFSRVVVLYGEPMEIPSAATATEGQLEQIRLSLEQNLRALKVDAERRVSRDQAVLRPALDKA